MYVYVDILLSKHGCVCVFAYVYLLLLIWLKPTQEEGVDFNVNGEIATFHGTLTVVSADNLASWGIGGYKALASAHRKCRFCMATSEDIHSKVPKYFKLIYCAYFSSLFSYFYSLLQRILILVLERHMLVIVLI